MIEHPVTGKTDFGLWSGLDAGRIEVLRTEQIADVLGVRARISDGGLVADGPIDLS